MISPRPDIGTSKDANEYPLTLFYPTIIRYIPVSLHELHSWAGSPTIYVVDCPATGEVLNAFAQIRSVEAQNDETGEHQKEAKGDIILVACRANQILPQTPQVCPLIKHANLCMPFYMREAVSYERVPCFQPSPTQQSIFGCFRLGSSLSSPSTPAHFSSCLRISSPLVSRHP